MLKMKCMLCKEREADVYVSELDIMEYEMVLCYECYLSNFVTESLLALYIDYIEGKKK